MSVFSGKPARAAYALLFCVSAALGGAPAGAAMIETPETAVVATDAPDLAKGMDAWEARDWEGVVLYMGKVVAADPGQDMVWTRLGYAWRRLGDYDKSLAAYDSALKLNPSNRGALEYLGEAYLQMGKIDEARKVASRLMSECIKASPTAAKGKFSEGCEEMALLKRNFEALGLKFDS